MFGSQANISSGICISISFSPHLGSLTSQKHSALMGYELPESKSIGGHCSKTVEGNEEKEEGEERKEGGKEGMKEGITEGKKEKAN